MIGRSLALAFGIITALLTSQVPEFVQQYRQRLGGAIDALRQSVERFDADAGASGLTREEGLTRLQTGPDDFVRRRGESEVVAMNRLERLEQYREAMRDAGPIKRLAAFLRYGDAQLADRTLRDFEPAVPTTIEGAVIAGAGFIAGYGLVRVLAAPFRRRGRRTAAKA